MRCKERGALALVFAAMLGFGGCGNAQGERASEAPPPAQVEREQDANVIQVDHPAQFPLSTAVAYKARSVLVVTGVVTPDVARNVPVITLASGRVVAIHARIGDRYKKVNCC
jgi:cobalt-zinc-cadmium efflux system membrane fusion protein